MQKKSLLQRIQNIIIKLYWISLILFIIIAIAMMIPGIAVYLRILQLADGGYLGFPGPLSLSASAVSFGFTNLWWVLVLLAPVVRFRNNRPFLGVAISVTAFTAMIFVPPIIIEIQKDTLLASNLNRTTTDRVIENVTSITIAADGCNDICERLLSGNTVSTVRTAKPENSKARHLQYHREASEECKAKDAFFDDNDICIIARLDDGMQSDLIIERSRALKRKQIGFTPRLLTKEAITIRETATQKVVASDGAVRWMQPTGYVPLLANTGFDGRGIHGGGLVPPQSQHESAPINWATMFEIMGINLADSLVVETKKANSYRARRKISRSSAPYDVALIRSIWKAGGLDGKTAFSFLKEWSSKLSQKEATADESENQLLSDLLSNTEAMGKTKNITLSAVLNALRKQSPGQNAIYRESFIENVTKEHTNGILIEVTGRHSFDPEPILRDYLSTSRNPASIIRVFLAYCRSDPQWVEKLTPLVLEYALSLHEDTSQHRKDKVLRIAFGVLEAQGQKKAWLELKAQITQSDFDRLRLSEHDGKNYCR